MQGLKIGDFGRFVFTDKYGYPKDIEGAEIDDMDQMNVWIKDMAEDGAVYNVAKKDIKIFEVQENKVIK